MLVKIRQGQIITADYLNQMATGINSLLDRPVIPPVQRNKPPPPELQNVDSEAESLSAYIESSRSTSTVQVFDQNEENYAEVERIDSVSLLNGYGQEIRLVFKNS